jgi:CheY-like chemotaxis protein/glycosyltransferase involved in cell wall biosynthesis
MSQRVLLVEDDVAIIELIKLGLKMKGSKLQLDVVHDGINALESVRQQRPNLVLLDVMLPGLDGFTTCSKLRKIPGMEDVPIIMVTALSQIEDKRRGYEAGADYFFTKPFSPTTLIQRVERHLGINSNGRSYQEAEVDDPETDDQRAATPSSYSHNGPFSVAPRVSVVIPTLNEADNLPDVLPWIPDWVDEVVLVDGNSTDGTVEVALSLRPDIKIVMQKNRGKGDALKEGFAASTGDIIVMLDADGSTDPAEIPAFVGALLAGADFAKGSRFLQGGGTLDMPFYRKLGNWGFVAVVRLFFGGVYSDLLYGYNAFWTRILPLIQVDTPGFEVETLMNIRALRARLRIAEVPSFESARLFGIPKLKAIPDGWKVLMTILKEYNEHRIKRINLAKSGVDDSERCFEPIAGRLFRDALHLWRSHDQLSPNDYDSKLRELNEAYWHLMDSELCHPDDKILKDYCVDQYGDKVPWAFAEETRASHNLIGSSSIRSGENEAALLVGIEASEEDIMASDGN